MEFPRLMYRSASIHHPVANEVERQAALKEGWFDSVPEAVAGKRATPAPRPAPVTVFKRAAGKLESATVKDQAEADALIAGDGWHATKAAAIAATWPAPDTVPEIMDGLSHATADTVAEYAAGLGMKVLAHEKTTALLARIETTLLTPPAA